MQIPSVFPKRPPLAKRARSMWRHVKPRAKSPAGLRIPLLPHGDAGPSDRGAARWCGRLLVKTVYARFLFEIGRRRGSSYIEIHPTAKQNTGLWVSAGRTPLVLGTLSKAL